MDKFLRSVPVREAFFFFSDWTKIDRLYSKLGFSVIGVGFSVIGVDDIAGTSSGEFLFEVFGSLKGAR